MNQVNQREILKTVLREVEWEFVQRRNAAMNMPSDFAVVRLTGDKKDEQYALKLLKTRPEVKGVHPQHRYKGVLKSDLNGTRMEDLEDFSISSDFLKDHHWYFMNEMKEGRFHSGFGFEFEDLSLNFSSIRRLHEEPVPITDLLSAQTLWKKGYKGQGIKVAIFDTGLEFTHPHFRKISFVLDWTDEGITNDLLGHGTFVAGIVASTNPECPGFADEAEILSYRVFTTKRVSYTSWFLDAFNHAIFLRVNVLNLSIGGPDFNDLPFVEKVMEMSANNIIVISAIGNDGPTYGTLNNPADQLDVIGVGGITFKDNIAKFSSRGMTTWEIPGGYGRVKPDVLAYSQNVMGSTPNGDCKDLSGTSVGSPVVAGAVTLLASSIPPEKRKSLLNPATIKQVLIEGAARIPDANIFEQGHGKLDLINSFQLLRSYTPKVSFSPPHLDLTDCPYMWPYCYQPLYYSGIPTVVNITILNGMGVTGQIMNEPEWLPGTNGHLVEVSFTYPKSLWPWSGYLAVHLRVSQNATNTKSTAEGVIRITVQSPAGPGEILLRNDTVSIPVKVNIVPTPERSLRILWDQFHNLRYPSGYFPRDVLKNPNSNSPFDWNGDHPHTNFKDLFTFLRDLGYFIEVLGEPFTCFNASNYGTLLIVDPEEEFYKTEISTLQDFIENNGLSLLVVGDWYNVEVMEKIKFFDDNSKQWWSPVTGGANIPALNEVLEKYEIEFGDNVYDGKFTIGNTVVSYLSGTAIRSFPENGILIPFELTDQTAEIVYEKKEVHKVPVLGLYQLPPNISREGVEVICKDPGRIVVFGDSSCLDSNRQVQTSCFPLLQEMLDFTNRGLISDNLKPYSPLQYKFVSQRLKQPKRVVGNKLQEFSKVHEGVIICHDRIYKSYNESNVVHIDWVKVVFRKNESVIPEDTVRRSTLALATSLFVLLLLIILFIWKNCFSTS
uniref:Uncharacterized protein n=1 Tax=Arcella intermedia TaxID=1963864 RepID=A0A6B2KXI5_9EUKA